MQHYSLWKMNALLEYLDLTTVDYLLYAESNDGGHF